MYRCCCVAAQSPCRCIYHAHITLLRLWETNSGLTLIQKHMETESEITADSIDQGINGSDFHGTSTSQSKKYSFLKKTLERRTN